MRDIAVSVMTFDRTPRENYLEQTLTNFTVAGGFLSARFHSLHIVDGGSPGNFSSMTSDWPHRAIVDIAYKTALPMTNVNGEPHVFVHELDHKVLACQNASRVLQAGLLTNAKWILFCEDDLDFCGDFLDGVGMWLDAYAETRYRVYPFGAAYPDTLNNALRGKFVWQYPVRLFYGTQCFAIRRDDALSLAHFWWGNPMVNGVNAPGAYDLMLQLWHRAQYPNLSFLLASAPSFVQHLGRQSIATGKKHTHTFDSWPGRNWAFNPQVVRV